LSEVPGVLAGVRAGPAGFLPFLWHRQGRASIPGQCSIIFRGCGCSGPCSHRDQPGIARVGGFYCASSNATITFIIVIGILLLGRYLNRWRFSNRSRCAPLLCHLFSDTALEWYDGSGFNIYDHKLVPWVDCGLATLYAVVYAALLLFGTWAVFRRKPLSV